MDNPPYVVCSDERFCEFKSAQGGTCKANTAHDGPAHAVIILTSSLPIGPTGTALCASHSPFDVPNREPQIAHHRSLTSRQLVTLSWAAITRCIEIRAEMKELPEASAQYAYKARKIADIEDALLALDQFDPFAEDGSLKPLQSIEVKDTTDE